MHDSTEVSAKKHDKQNGYDMTSAVGTCKPMRARVPPAALSGMPYGPSSHAYDEWIL
jgi:hypothetical protein